MFDFVLPGTRRFAAFASLVVLVVSACGPAGTEAPSGGSGGGAPQGAGGTQDDLGTGGDQVGTGGAGTGVGGQLGPGTGGSTQGAGGESFGAGGIGDPESGGSAGTGGDGSGGSASGGSSGLSTDRGDFGLGGESRCSGDFLICEDFEAVAPGALPVGYSLVGYGTRTVAVTDVESARGARSLQIDVDGGQSAVVAMVRVPNTAGLAARHFGRMFYRIQGPGVPEFVHFDVLEFVGPWMGHQNGVRFASTGTGVGTTFDNWSWIYNVQPSGDGAGSEFGSEGDRSGHPVVDEWMCLEWMFDAAQQTATYFHDGAPIEYLVIDEERAEIPEFSELNVGLQKFQPTGGFRVWVDELAFDDERIGCNH